MFVPSKEALKYWGNTEEKLIKLNWEKGRFTRILSKSNTLFSGFDKAIRQKKKKKTNPKERKKKKNQQG